jgi:hypothetical protein
LLLRQCYRVRRTPETLPLHAHGAYPCCIATQAFAAVSC